MLHVFGRAKIFLQEIQNHNPYNDNGNSFEHINIENVYESKDIVKYEKTNHVLGDDLCDAEIPKNYYLEDRDNSYETTTFKNDRKANNTLD